jgi:hypothetical protein
LPGIRRALAEALHLPARKGVDMKRLVALLAVVLVVGWALPAGAAPPTTETTVDQGTETFVEFFTCDPGDLYLITITFRLVEHITAFPDGRVHESFTETGTFEAEALDPSEPDASGHFAISGSFNDTRGAVAGTFTFNVTGEYEDGTRINTHFVGHFTETPTGTQFFFERCRD